METMALDIFNAYYPCIIALRWFELSTLITGIRVHVSKIQASSGGNGHLSYFRSEIKLI